MLNSKQAGIPGSLLDAWPTPSRDSNATNHGSSMCRLFGFRSVIPSQVHRSLLAAENALGVQSNQHPDGWGVAFYVDGSPHVTRSPTTALGDALFHRLSGVVSSETVLAHVRKATQGSSTIFNCHPFQYGRWVFAHNGDIPNFEAKREALLSQVAPHFRRFILGETDSEVLFFVFLSALEQLGPLGDDHDIDSINYALKEAVSRARALCDTDGTLALLTVVATNGECLVAAQGGKNCTFLPIRRAARTAARVRACLQPAKRRRSPEG